MGEYRLFMLLLGSSPAGRNTEQHDVFFTIVKTLHEVIPAVHKFWPEAVGNIHIDGWREVNCVDGFNIVVKERNQLSSNEQTETLFFINLGGYKKNEFEEFHYKIVTVAKSKGEAVKRSKQSAFYLHTGYKGAESHIDDKYGVDADDVHAIDDILSKDEKEKFQIIISKAINGSEDEIQMGYLTLNRLEKTS